MVKMSMDIFDGRAFDRALKKGMRAASEATARAAVVDVTRRIPMRITPDGGAQKPNEPATRKAKQRRLGHDIPLQDKRILADPKKYKIVRKGNSFTGAREIHPPPERLITIRHLRDRGYKLFEISPEVVKFFGDAMQAEIDKLHAMVGAGAFVRKQKP